ncbi:glycosyltransferase [Sulfitobacter pontiacus]
MRAGALHALCEPEHRQFAFGYRGPVAIIANGLFSLEGPKGAAAGVVLCAPAGAKVLLFLGQLHPKKGLDRLSRLCHFSRAGSRTLAPRDRRLGSGRHSAALAAQAEALGLSPRVHFIGPQFGDQKAATLAVADAFVLPSQRGSPDVSS